MDIRNGPDGAAPGDPAPADMVASEFATVAVRLDHQANGVRLARLLDPSADRWRDD